MSRRAQLLDRLFHALSDPTRRDILRRVGEEQSVSALARSYPLSFAAVQKHVAVLEQAGLVTKHRRGREHLIRPVPAALDGARSALEVLGENWRQRIERMDALPADQPAAPGQGRATPDPKEGQVP